MPILSIITVNLNNAIGLRKTIESVVSQTFENFEFIIIDGASTDGSSAIIKEYEARIQYWVSEPDKGIYYAMNKGILSSNGDILLFLNSGDSFFDNNVVKEVIELMLTNDGYEIYYGKILAKDEKRTFITGRNLMTKDFKLGLLPDHQATFIKRKVFIELGLYNTEYKIYSDYDFMLKCFIMGKNFFYLDKLVSIYQLGGCSSNDDSYLILILKYFGFLSFIKATCLKKLSKLNWIGFLYNKFRKLKGIVLQN